MQIDYKQMRKVCLAPIDWFKQYGEVSETKDGIYIHKDNGAKILAVAHLDTVRNDNHFYHMVLDRSHVVFNSQLDDRLGAYVILDLLPKLGLKYDILLTEGEERGMSTAGYFETTKQYNWIFSFDRQGDDVVMYEYDNKFLRRKVLKAGMRPGDGSFSDICWLEHLGCKGMNVGTGYHLEHGSRCYAEMGELLGNVQKFVKFYEMFKDQLFYHKPSPVISNQGFGTWSELDDPRAYDRDGWKDGGKDDWDSPEHNKHYRMVSKEPDGDDVWEDDVQDDSDMPPMGYSGKHTIKYDYNSCKICHAIFWISCKQDPEICIDCGMNIEKCDGCDEWTSYKQLDLAGFCPKCQAILKEEGVIKDERQTVTISNAQNVAEKLSRKATVARNPRAL